MKIVIELTELEEKVLMELAVDKELAPQQVMSKALRIYQLVEMKMKADPEWIQHHLLRPQPPKMAAYVANKTGEPEESWESRT